MFDNTKPNVIFLADATENYFMSKTIGPYKLANELRNKGFEVAVIHHLHVFSVDEIKEILSNTISNKTLFVGVSNFFYKNLDQRESLIDRPTTDLNMFGQGGAILPHGQQFNTEIKLLIKHCNPNCKLVLGGPWAADAGYIKDFDYVVLGYADVSIVNLAQHLANNSVLDKSWKSLHGPVIVDDSLASDHDFANSLMSYAEHDCILPGETLPIEIGRGCIFRCSFCAYPLNGKKKLDHIKKEKLLLQEFMDNYNKFGITRYVFSDDTFNDSLEKVDMIWRISQQLPFDLEFWAYTRLDLLAAHPYTIDKLIDSGQRAFFFGIETLNQETGSIIGKGGNREKLIQVMRDIKTKYGNQVMLHGSFIIGLPKESRQSIEQTLDFLLSDQSPLDSFRTHPLTISDKKKSLAFKSDLELDPAKYGYTIVSKVFTGMEWKSDHLTLHEAQDIANNFAKTAEEKNSSALIGFYSFNIAGLGFDLSFTRNKKSKEIDWPAVAAQKVVRARQYKNLVRQHIAKFPASC